MKLRSGFLEALLILFAIGVGALAGVGTLGFLALIALGQWSIWPAGENFLAQVILAPWWLKLLVPVLGGLALGPVIAFLVPELRGPGVSEVVEAAALEDSYIRPKVTILKTLCTALSIVTGGSLGREGPVATIGAALGSSLGRFFKFSPQKVRVALACGAAAGIAATFNAPFAGTMFAVEIILGDIQIAYLGPIALAAIISVIVVHQIWAGFPIFIAPGFQLQHPGELGLYVLLGLLGGLLAILFIRGVSTADTLFRKLPLPEWLKPGLGGLGLGLIGLWCPHVFGVGYDSINLALTGKLTLDAATMVLLAKFLATIICLGSMSGGVFGPSLFLGAMLGTSLALTGNFFFPHLSLNPVDYALVGMGTVVSGVTLGPITAILIIFEPTHNFRTIVPLMLSCVTSLLIVKSLYGYSIYQTKLLRRGIHLVRGLDVNILRTLRVKECLTSQVETINDDARLPEILEKAEASPYPFFIVLDSRGELSGVLTLADLRQDLRFAREISRVVTAAELKTPKVFTITPDDDLQTALELFEGRNLKCLPVVLPPEKKIVVGILKQEDLLTAYKQKLLKVRLRQREGTA
jgi:CIC family chloride channel protein